jgi:hypothetical protein
MRLKFALALAALGMSSAANATLLGTQVNGSLTFSGGGPNYFLAGNGFVPAGYGNSAGQPVTIGSGTEFGFADSANTDTANFTDTQLIITDIASGDGNSQSTYSFTSLTPGAFAGLTLASSSFPVGFTYGLVGDTITLDFNGFNGAGTYVTTFNVATAVGSVPEPATWAMMLLGFAAIGISVRRKRSARTLSQHG